MAGKAGARPAGPQKAGSAVAGLRGGMHTLVTALVADLRHRGVTLLSGTRADAVERIPAGWRVTAAGIGHDAGLVVIAVEGPAAVGLLEGAVPGLAAHRPAGGPDVSLVTLVVNHPDLDAAPRGTGVLVAPQSPGIRAKALTHATAKWGWLAARAGAGVHVLRLSYGRSGDAEQSGQLVPGAMTGVVAPRSEDELFHAALQDASALLSTPVTAGDVLGWDVVRWSGVLPFASLGHKQRVAEVRGICAREASLAVVGGWLSGNGLAAIVADTPKEVRRLLARP